MGEGSVGGTRRFTAEVGRKLRTSDRMIILPHCLCNGSGFIHARKRGGSLQNLRGGYVHSCSQSAN